MKVLVVGGGGREHAMVCALAKSPKVDKLWCAPGNGGIAAQAECVNIKATDVASMVAFAKENQVDYVVVAPDDPLALGMVDALAEAGIPAFGPHKNAAIIEASKSFSKDLMKKYHIPTAKYEIFTDMEQALAYVRAEGAPIVVKADGPGQGRGGSAERGRGRRRHPLHDGRQKIRRSRRPGGYRGVHDRPRGIRPLLCGRGASQPHAVLPGSQARL